MFLCIQRSGVVGAGIDGSHDDFGDQLPAADFKPEEPNTRSENL